MYYFVKMSSGWIGKKISDVASHEYIIQEYVDCGDIVAFSDDVGSFADAVGISEDDIKML